MPVIIGWNDEHDNYTRLPLRGSTPPLNILLEVHRTHPYDGTDEDKYRVVTVTYTVLGFKRQIILRKTAFEHRAPVGARLVGPENRIELARFCGLRQRRRVVLARIRKELDHLCLNPPYGGD